jgi:hypothetical protein
VDVKNFGNCSKSQCIVSTISRHRPSQIPYIMSIPRSCWRLSTSSNSLRHTGRQNLRRPSWHHAHGVRIPQLQQRCLASQASAPSPSKQEIPEDNLEYSVYPDIYGGKGFQVADLINPHDEHLVTNGIGDLYTPKGFKTAYGEWQAYILTELNKRVDDGKCCQSPSLDYYHD